MGAEGLAGYRSCAKPSGLDCHLAGINATRGCSRRGLSGYSEGRNPPALVQADKAARISAMRRAVQTLLLVFAFLFAQGGLIAHSATHLAPVSHAGDKGLPSDSTCASCVGFAQMAGSAPLPEQSPLPHCVARQEVPHAQTPVPATRTAYRLRARAPPAFS
jgi:hypothetical protein